MKKMKKLLCVLLAVMIVVAFAACGEQNSNTVDNPYNLVTPGTLTVSLSPDFSPMEFVDVSKSGQDQYVGFDVTLAKYIAAELGVELLIKPMSFDASQGAVEMGNVDMSISGYSWTEKRAQNYNLSDFYYAGDNETEQVIITLKEHEGEWTKASDFSGLTVGAQVASLQMDLCTSQLPEDCTIKTFTDIGTAVEALRNGNIDALAVARGNGRAISASNENIVESGFQFEIDEKAENNLILLKKGADDLTDKVNEILAKAYEAGLYGEWYDEASALAGIDTAAEIEYDDDGNAVEN